MTRQSEQLEREAEETRFDLARSLRELRSRATPGQIADQVFAYTRQGPVADLLRNLSRDIKENPLPLLLIGAGIAWAIIASAIRTRGAVLPPREMPSPSRTSVVEARPEFAQATQPQDWEVAPLTEPVE